MYLKTITLICILSLCGHSFAQPNGSKVAWDKLQALQGTDYFSVQHKPDNKDTQVHHIFIKLPAEYAEQTDRRFPTLYLLDGGTNFPLFSAYYDYLRWMEDVPPMIIVGLSYGTHDWQKGNNRSHDFTAPSKEKTHYGGAANFDAFLHRVLIPKIESAYRTDNSKHILFGQSLGGQFALYSAMYGKSPFFAVIASNPAIHGNLAFYQQAVINRAYRPKIIITLAEFDDQRFKTPFNQWHQHWQDQNAAWQYQLIELPHHNHLSATPESIRRGLKSLFTQTTKVTH